MQDVRGHFRVEAANFPFAVVHHLVVPLPQELVVALVHVQVVSLFLDILKLGRSVFDLREIPITRTIWLEIIVGFFRVIVWLGGLLETTMVETAEALLAVDYTLEAVVIAGLGLGIADCGLCC